MTRKKKPTTSLVRSSAAEYLTFVAASGTGGVETVYADENVWLSQKMRLAIYALSHSAALLTSDKDFLAMRAAGIPLLLAAA
jgi:hypothetical protein